ncbi:MAG: endolytic transglycosylase MltG [Calditrichaeota bacterium]|nr:MAG: endolytic transglycosylase MltG [Calditrichota bacterium]
MGVENKLKHGKFLIPKRSNNVQILRLLKAGRPFEELITIPEGVTSRKIASILHRRVNMDSVAFMQVVQDSAFAHQLGIEANSLEGYLFPNTYRFYWEIEPRVAARIMVEEFFRQLPDSAEVRARKMGFTLHQIVTLASIIEGEAVVDSERTIISAVYHNRLRKGILLQADPTIQFIIPDGPRRLLKADLQIDSPYNTYKYPGLPPGPINNPGKKSIEAALAPAEVPYLYFVARGDGSHVFSASYSQHRRAKRAFDRIRREVERKQKQQEHTQ